MARPLYKVCHGLRSDQMSPDVCFCLVLTKLNYFSASCAARCYDLTKGCRNFWHDGLGFLELTLITLAVHTESAHGCSVMKLIWPKHEPGPKLGRPARSRGRGMRAGISALLSQYEGALANGCLSALWLLRSAQAYAVFLPEPLSCKQKLYSRDLLHQSMENSSLF